MAKSLHSVVFVRAYTRRGADLLPARVGASDDVIVGGGCYSLSADDDLICMTLDEFRESAARVTSGHKGFVHVFVGSRKDGHRNVILRRGSCEQGMQFDGPVPSPP